MKKTYAVVLIALMSGLAVAESGVTITETRLENGDSTIKVVNDISGVTKNYKINMSRHHYPATSADDPLVKKYKSWEFGAFLCYNSNQYSGTEFCSSKDPVKDFNPASLDVKQWVKTVKDVGMDYAVLTVKHTGDFLLWDSDTSEIKVTNSSYNKDLVKEYVTECRKAGIAPGIYYCLWGGTWNPNPNARAIILAQLHELATQYGEIPYFWLDMPHSTGWLTKDLSQQEIYDSLKNVSPNSVVMFNNAIQDGSVIKAFPTDVINGEMCSPPVEGHDPWRTVDGKRYYIPFEYEPCSQKRGTHVLGLWDFPGASWFTYGDGKDFAASESFSAEFLYKRIRVSLDRGANNILISCAPDHTGSFRKADITELVKLGKLLKDPSLATPRPITYGGKASSSGDWNENYTADRAFDDSPSTRWGGVEDSKDGWLAIDFGKDKQFSKVTISEGWDRIRKFELQIKKNGRWQTIHKGTMIGNDYSATFKSVTAQHVRLNILKSTDAPTIWELQLFESNDLSSGGDFRGIEGGLKAYCIDFNWANLGTGRVSEPGLWADADPVEHVKWYKSLGANVIQTFAVSCNGYAWYKDSIVPEQPGLKHDFLTEMVKLGHKENMKVMGYFCVAANLRWGQLYPEESYPMTAMGHLPLTKKYNKYLAGAIKDALEKTDMDGFMIDWLFHGPIHKTDIKWLDCEVEMWGELMDGPFPGEDKVTKAQGLEFARRSVDRCWKVIKHAAKSTKSDCIIWLTVHNLNHPQIANSDMLKETDWLMNEGGAIKELREIQKELGRGNLINCLAAWNGADPKTVVPASIKAGIGLYGFTRPVKGDLLPSIEDYYLAKDIDELTGDEANIAMLARAYRGLPFPAEAISKDKPVKVSSTWAAKIFEFADRVRTFALEYRSDKNKPWRTAFTGTTIGNYHFKQFKPVRGRYFRLNMKKAIAEPTIWEFQLFNGNNLAKGKS